MLASEPFSRPPESRLDFVRNEKNAVLATDVLQQPEIISRRDDEATLPEDRLCDKRCDRFGRHYAFECIFKILNEIISRSSWVSAQALESARA